MDERPLVSVVLSSFTTDRLNDIFEVLISVKNQTYPNIEIIFVAEKMPELTKLIEKFARENGIHNIRMFYNSGKPGLSTARNIGIRESTGDIIAFTDDDVILFPDWVENMVKGFGDSSVVGMTGPAVPLWEDRSMDWLPREFYWIISCSAWCEWDKIVDVRNTWGMNMAFKKESFSTDICFSPDIGGVHGTRLHSEEVDLCQKIKKKTKKRIVFNPDIKVQHKVYKYRLTMRYIAKTSYWIGYTRKELKKTYSREADGGNLLNTETHLLKNILTRLPLDIFKSLFSHPGIAWNKCNVTVVSLSSVAWGYCSFWAQNNFHRNN